MRRPLLLAALLAGAAAPPADAATVATLAYAGTGVHYCTTQWYGTSCHIDATSSTACAGATEQATVTCTVTVTGGYGIPRTEPPTSNTSCSASGRATVRVTDSLGTAYPLVVGSLSGSGGAFEFDGVGGTAPDLTAVYGRFTISPLCGKQGGRLAGVVVSS